MSFIQMGLFFVAGSLLLLILALRLRRIPIRRVLSSLIVATVTLFVLTAIFDNVMIASGLFDYGQHLLVGVHLGLAPVEDFLYPLCAVMFMPALWWLFGGRKPQQVEEQA
ncbi:lycopene cyclase domain-containing protein [Glutamicibacter uratoxydans]|uniref:lycopene cyclase domain-containing protein n=1 Tax=Glutamicibacter uratoxydans TaxID=43667 RepID=UPI003D6F9BE8